ncbi:Fe-S protein assembly co-chaperone HscB [Alphaproteobacteria bacterium]|nr:Fe-S protein assembly co-chaperone HscB [Alphaproteobacteria bacterium]
MLKSAFLSFDLVEEFSLDLSRVHKSYLSLQNRLHPDRFFNNETEKKRAQKYSSHINWAYRVLKDPIRRAEILLESTPDNFPVEDLMEQMEKRENLESLSKEEDFKGFKKNIAQERLQAEKEMALFFKERKPENAKKRLIKIQYLIKLEQEASNKIKGT